MLRCKGIDSGGPDRSFYAVADGDAPAPLDALERVARAANVLLAENRLAGRFVARGPGLVELELPHGTFIRIAPQTAGRMQTIAGQVDDAGCTSGRDDGPDRELFLRAVSEANNDAIEADVTAAHAKLNGAEGAVVAADVDAVVIDVAVHVRIPEHDHSSVLCLGWRRES